MTPPSPHLLCWFFSPKLAYARKRPALRAVSSDCSPRFARQKGIQQSWILICTRFDRQDPHPAVQLLHQAEPMRLLVKNARGGNVS